MRWYEQTWIVQHLAALPLSARGLDASARVNLAFSYYAQLRPDVQWVKMFYRPNNAWPSRVFGGFAGQVKDTRTSDLRVFHYLAAATNGPLPKFPGQICVRAADENNLGQIEDWFISRGRTVEVMANDLRPSLVSLASVTRLFGTVGLHRRRESIVAFR